MDGGAKVVEAIIFAVYLQQLVEDLHFIVLELVFLGSDIQCLQLFNCLVQFSLSDVGLDLEVLEFYSSFRVLFFFGLRFVFVDVLLLVFVVRHILRELILYIYFVAI